MHDWSYNQYGANKPLQTSCSISQHLTAVGLIIVATLEAPSGVWCSSFAAQNCIECCWLPHEDVMQDLCPAILLRWGADRDVSLVQIPSHCRAPVPKNGEHVVSPLPSHALDVWAQISCSSCTLCSTALSWTLDTSSHGCNYA